MGTLPRRSQAQLGCSLVIGLIFLGLIVTGPVQADVGPQPILPGGSSLKPEGETPIQMAAEIVTMNVRPATAADNALVKLNPRWYGYDLQPIWYPAVAEVKADFTMKNPTSEAVSMIVWFPLNAALEKAEFSGERPSEIVPRLESFQVSVDGAPLDFTVSELPNPQGADNPPLPWASFPVTFPSGVDTPIHVSYTVPLTPFPKEPVMSLFYIFQTGAGWAGPIGQADLIVNLPYPASEATLADLPPGAVLKENQTRWTWQNLEPDPEDDFAITLLRLDRWQELETARLAVQANPQNGQAWLDLASIYHSLSLYNLGLHLYRFSPSYLPLGIEAYQKAADLLPDHPAPRAGLALLTLAQYLENKHAPPNVIRFVEDEYQIAKELANKNPSLAEESNLLVALEDALYAYDYNEATATVIAATRAVERVTETADRAAYDATQTVEATLNHATGTAYAIERATYEAWWATDMACWAAAGAACTATAPPTVTLTPKPTLTPQPTTPILSVTPQPSLTTSNPLVQPGQTFDQRRDLAISLFAGVIALVVIGYFVWKGPRGKKND
jgi:tetratricopeptide (TPR) repeat protein